MARRLALEIAGAGEGCLNLRGPTVIDSALSCWSNNSLTGPL